MNDAWVLVCVAEGRIDNEHSEIFWSRELARAEMESQYREELDAATFYGYGSPSYEMGDDHAFVDDVHWVIRKIENV
jgi:hypothetical protein